MPQMLMNVITHTPLLLRSHSVMQCQNTRRSCRQTRMYHDPIICDIVIIRYCVIHMQKELKRMKAECDDAKIAKKEAEKLRERMNTMEG